MLRRFFLLACIALTPANGVASDAGSAALRNLDDAIALVESKEGERDRSEAASVLPDLTKALLATGDRDAILVAVGALMSLVRDDDAIEGIEAVIALARIGVEARPAVPRLLRALDVYLKAEEKLYGVAPFGKVEITCEALLAIMTAKEFAAIEPCQIYLQPPYRYPPAK